MISKYSHNSLIWIDLESPKEEEIFYLMEEYSIPTPIEEEIRTKSKESKTKLYSGLVFISLNFPQILNKNNKILDNKIIFIVNNNFVITIHDEPIEALSEFLNNLEMDTTLPEELRINNNGLLFFYLIKSLYVNLKEQLIINKVEIKELENTIIGGKNKNASKLIYNKNQSLIKAGQCLNSHEIVFEVLPKLLIQIFSDKFEYYSSLIVDEYSLVKQMIEQQEKNFINLYNINNLILTDKNNKKIKILTRLSIITLIITIITFLYVFSNI